LNAGAIPLQAPAIGEEGTFILGHQTLSWKFLLGALPVKHPANQNKLHSTPKTLNTKAITTPHRNIEHSLIPKLDWYKRVIPVIINK